MTKIIVSDSPHIRSPRTTKGIMIDVLIALLPALIMGCIYFGFSALYVVAISCFGAVATELVYSLCQKKKIQDIAKDFDFSSLVTGLLLGMTLSSTVPFYVPLISSVFSVAVVKMLFGGTGKNIVNPAITGRIFAFIAFQGVMISGYESAFIGAIATENAVTTGATVLTQMLNGGGIALSNLDLFLGTGVMGCIGETSKIALLLGGIYLVVKRVIDWKWPVLYIGATGLMAVAFNGFDFSAFLPNILSGGLFIGAIFMATDYVTSPSTDKARYFYYIILGVLTAILRQATKIEVVSFSILLMNLLVPVFNNYIKPKIFGAPSKLQIWKAKLASKKEGK